MTQNKRLIGITGGSGTGKSYLSARLRDNGIPVIDCDIVSRQIMAKDTPCAKEVTEFFGNGILENGEINRRKLGNIVFQSPEKLKKLNEITHKYILADIYDKMEKEESELVCVDGATLIESGIKCHMMIGVIADYELRKKRIMERDGLSEEEAIRRIGAQQKDSFYEKNCDFIIYNKGEIDVDAVLEQLKKSY